MVNFQFYQDDDTPDDHRKSLEKNIRLFFGKFATESIENAIINIRWDNGSN